MFSVSGPKRSGLDQEIIELIGKGDTKDGAHAGGEGEGGGATRTFFGISFKNRTLAVYGIAGAVALLAVVAIVAVAASTGGSSSASKSSTNGEYVGFRFYPVGFFLIASDLRAQSSGMVS